MRRILKSKWLWPLWFLFICAVLYRGWQEVMARPCHAVWSPNKQFKVEYYVYGYVPGWYDYIHGTSDSFVWPGFVRTTDKSGRTIERKDEGYMSVYGCTCIGIQAQPTKPSKNLLKLYGCTGSETPDEIVAEAFGGIGAGGHTLWRGRLKDGKGKWYVRWGSGQAENNEAVTYLPASPLD